jgi:hypothetical protein
MSRHDQKLHLLLDKLQDTYLDDERKLAEQVIIIAGTILALLSLGKNFTPIDVMIAVSVIFSIGCGLLFFIVRLVESIESHQSIEEISYPDLHKLKIDLDVLEKLPHTFKLLERGIAMIGGRRTLLLLQLMGLILAAAGIIIRIL